MTLLKYNFDIRPKNVSFPETSEYFLGSVGRQTCFSRFFFFTLEKHENHSKYPKNREKKISDVS